MKRILASLAVLFLLCAPTYAQKTKAALTTEINTNWPDNTTGAITPALLRSTVTDIVNSYFDFSGASSNGCATHQWVASMPTLSTIACSQPIYADIASVPATFAIGANLSPPGTSLLMINANTVAPVGLTTGSEYLLGNIVAPNNDIGAIIFDTFGPSSSTNPNCCFGGLAFRRADGTASAPTPLASGDIIGTIDAHGNDGNTNAGQSGYMLAGSSQLRFNATENWAATASTSTNNGSDVTILATPNGLPTVGNLKLIASFVADTVSAVSETIGLVGSTVGSSCLTNATSGKLCLAPPTGALGANVLTLPNATDTLTANVASQTLSNKILTSPTLSGNTVASGSAPTCAATGIGNTGTCALGANANDFAGAIVLTAGGSGIASTGTITLTLNVAFPHVAVCQLMALNSTGLWTAPVTFINTTVSASAPGFSWYNGSTNLTNGSIYDVLYHCIGL